jgi:hypothetical protein
MRGSLTAQSDGLGTGATFILELPLAKVTVRTASEEEHKLDTLPEHFAAAAA